MNFFTLNDQILRTREEIRKRIARLQNWGSVEGARALGIGTDKQVGASFPSLKKLAESYEKEKELAILLWGCQQREEQIVACMLLPDTTAEEEIRKLAETAINAEIAEYLGSLHIAHRKDIATIVQRWSESDVAFLQIAGLTGGARHLLLNKTNPALSADSFLNLLTRPYSDPYVRLIAKRYQTNFSV